MNKCVVICAEGDTEVEFYKKLISRARKKCPNERFSCRIEYINAHGIGGYKNIVLRKFIKDIKQPYTKKYGEDCSFVVILCRDTDVFELSSSNPPVNWIDVEKGFKDEGVQRVFQIKAKHLIEDWFLYDSDGVISFLHLPKGTKVSGSNGLEKMKNLYKKANRVYFKGKKSDGLIEKLDIDKIVERVYGKVKPLYRELGVPL